MDMSFLTSVGVAVAVVCLVAALASLFLLKRFVHGRPDALLVVMGAVGRDRHAKILHGGVTFVWPVIQSWDWLSLTPITVNLSLKGALSRENIRVHVPCAFIVAVDSENVAVMEKAAVRLLEIIKNKQAFNSFVEDIIFGQMRAVIAGMSISQINGNRQEFQEQITSAVSTELAKVGLKLITVNIQDISDEASYIVNLGKSAAAEAEADASIAIAEHGMRGETETTKKDAVRRQNVSNNELAAITTENANRARIAESQAELARLTQETQAKNESLAQITMSEEQKKAALVKAENELQVYEAQERTARAREQLARASMLVEATPETEREVLVETARGRAEGGKLKERMKAEAEGVQMLLEARARGIQKIVEAAGGDANAAVLLLMSEKLPSVMQEYARLAATRPIDRLVCIDDGTRGGAVSSLTSSLIAGLPKIQDVLESLGVEFGGRKASEGAEAGGNRG